MGKHARVYHGRWKGNSECHGPNDKSREGMENTEWESTINWECDGCGLVHRIHRLDKPIFRCPNCGCNQEAE